MLNVFILVYNFKRRLHVIRSCIRKTFSLIKDTEWLHLVPIITSQSVFCVTVVCIAYKIATKPVLLAMHILNYKIS
jgi:hypothetical protein